MPHFKFEENLLKYEKQTFKKNSFFLRGLHEAPGAFHTLFKNHYKAINPCLITLKFGTDKQSIPSFFYEFECT